MALAVAAGLAACASIPPPAPAGPNWSGRIAVRSDAAPGKDARSMTGQFELTGTASAGQLVVASPLGTTVARARWGDVYAEGRPSDIVLQAQGRTVRFSDFESMTEAALGDAVPLEALFDWLDGRPWPGSPAVVDADRGAFDQLGWHVDRSRLAADGLLSADRPAPLPALHVRVKLDAPVAAEAASSASAGTPAGGRLPAAPPGPPASMASTAR
jgi:outer membrane lipoprotein LolB